MSDKRVCEGWNKKCKECHMSGSDVCAKFGSVDCIILGPVDKQTDCHKKCLKCDVCGKNGDYTCVDKKTRCHSSCFDNLKQTTSTLLMNV